MTKDLFLVEVEDSGVVDERFSRWVPSILLEAKLYEVFSEGGKPDAAHAVNPTGSSREAVFGCRLYVGKANRAV